MSTRALRVRVVFALASLSLTAAFASAAWGATANEAGYACQLVRTGLISATYGKGSSVGKRSFQVSEAYGKGTTRRAAG